jgi:hypothetical protein
LTSPGLRSTQQKKVKKSRECTKEVNEQKNQYI